MPNEDEVARWLQEIVRKVKEGEDPKQTGSQVEALVEWTAVAIGLWRIFPGSKLGDVEVTKFIVKGDQRDQRRSMLIVTGTRKGKKLITFHSGTFGADLFKTFQERAAAGSLTWKDDTPFNGGSQEADSIPLPALMGP